MDKNILKRFFGNACTPEERNTVLAWLQDPANDDFIKNWMKENWDYINNMDPEKFSTMPDLNRIWLNVKDNLDHIQVVLPQSETEQNPVFPIDSSKRWWKFAAAAAILFFISGALFWWQNLKPVRVTVKNNSKENAAPIIDIAPPDNSNKAVLTLADGSKLYLDSAGNQLLATQDKVKVLKNEKGEIVYSNAAEDVVQLNTLTVPKGCKPVRLILADGTIVWLNAASSVTYPTAFIRDARKVTITGEAYFEVAKNPAMPFYVAHNNVQVKVLGTHFNLNTYDDENNVKLTLLEGAVNVTNGNTSDILSPGQQAQIDGNKISLQNNIDLEAVMAWKNNEFYFNGTDIKTIMRQLEKYYNVEIEYKDQVPYQFIAKISREVKISEILKILELTNLIHFKIEANKIIVVK